MDRRNLDWNPLHFFPGVLRALCFYLLCCSYAAASSGLSWLSNQVREDGSYHTAADIASPEQATAETLRTFQLLKRNDLINPAAALSYLDAVGLRNSEFLARKMIAHSEAGDRAVDAEIELGKIAGRDGGYGEFAGYQSTNLDTAYALEAFAVADRPISIEIALSVGFLLGQQHADGGWPASVQAGEGSSVFATALVLKALSHYRAVYDLEQVFAGGRQYLLSKKNADALWDEPYLSALAMIALIHLSNDLETIADSIEALRTLQQDDGSWNHDVYTTALALRALHAEEAVPVNPLLSSLRGRFLDGISGLPLADVSVLIDGPATGTVTTTNSGEFQFVDLVAGHYSLRSELSGYSGVFAETTTGPGQTVDFGDIRLLPQTGGFGPVAATVGGVVTDAATGLPLEDVTVALSGADSDTVSTDSSGAYQFTGVVPGGVMLHASKAGYSTATGSATLTAGSRFLFSPKLMPSDLPVTAVTGTVTNGASGQALEGVRITLSGSTVAQTLTDAAGSYRINGVVPGKVGIEASMVGYDSVKVDTVIFENNIVTFSPVLYSANTSPPGANLSGLTGLVVDAATNEPLPNVAVALTVGAEYRDVLTAADGRFSFDGIDGELASLAISKDGYDPSEFAIPLNPLEVKDIGQVRLREETLDELLPDLAVSAVDLSQTVQDPNTLEMIGNLPVSIENLGTAAAQLSGLMAFYDADSDGVYRSGSDVLLGESSPAAQLSVGESRNFVIAIQGRLPFRDAPVSVWVDSGQSQIESNESNNVYSSSGQCTLEAGPIGELAPVEKWRWSGSSVAPSYNQVMSTPMVGQLNDDNGDGKIDNRDNPDIVFTTFRGNKYSENGKLRAINGKNGAEIWTVAPDSTANNSPAIADIDNDGLVEIVVGGPYRNGLRVYENDGSLKWQIPVTGSSFPSVADLNNDGIVEIIYGPRIFSPDGVLLVELQHGGNAPIAVDLDADGEQEIVANGFAYRNDGSVVLWDSGFRGTYGAVGNFDDDEFPEIALRDKDLVVLLNHDGSLLWGPVAVPGGGGGPLTVSDVDGDGRPEIGVAGGRNYAVIETDGSIKWTSRTRDYSSAVTGSSVFDFESDGKAEILYNDEFYFRIYDGATGKILFQKQNTSGTLREFPVVADIDNDGHAEVVLASNNYAFGGKTGIRVFENSNDLWAPTRSIFNQHAYHIDNVNDDGSIPPFERPSWLGHNTYRLNTFPDRNPLSATDLTVALLRYQEKGATQDLTVRLGNAGLAPRQQPFDVAFYEGDPANGGRYLGRVEIPSIAGNAYRDITLEGTMLSGAEAIYVKADFDDRVAECNELNNAMQIPVPRSTLGKITVATDRPVYGPEQEVRLQASVANHSPFTGNFIGLLQIEDAMGTPIRQYPDQPIEHLSGGSGAQFSLDWHTARYLSGPYVVRGRLIGDDGVLQDESVALFNIVHSSDQHDPLVTLRTTTDKPIYHTTAPVRIEDLISNVTLNGAVEQVRLLVRVIDPSGRTLLDQSLELGPLLPGALRDLSTGLALNQAMTGEYAVLGVVLDAQTNAILAAGHASFLVQDESILSLTGDVTAALKIMDAGQTQTCVDRVINTGNADYDRLSIRQSVARLDIPAEISLSQTELRLTSGATHSMERHFSTEGLEAGDYACVLQAFVEASGQWVTLDYDFFRINQPVRIDAQLTPGDRGRVLILLDKEPEVCVGVTDLALESALAIMPSATAEAWVELKDRNGQLLDRETAAIDSRMIDLNAGSGNLNLTLDEFTATHLTVSISASPVLNEAYQIQAVIADADGETPLSAGAFDPVCPSEVRIGDKHQDFRIISLQRPPSANDSLGPNHIPDLITQRDTLEDLLTEVGWSYTIVTDADSFAREFHSGSYVTYMLLSEHVKLSEQLQKELREALYRGEGLIEAGSHDQRQGRIDEALGITFLGKHPDMSGVKLAESAVGAAGQAEFSLKDRTLRATASESAAIGDFRTTDGDTQETAATVRNYGAGRALYAGFDLLAETALAGADPLFGRFLLDALSHVHSDALMPFGGGVYPVRIALANQGIATPGRVILTLPANVGVVDAGGADSIDNALIWPFELLEAETLVFNSWLTLPAEPFRLDALAQTGIDPDYLDHAALTLTITPVSAETVDEALNAALALNDPDYKQVVKYLEWARNDNQNGDYAAALSALVRASDALIAIGTPESDALRSRVAETMRGIAAKL
ncbi:MAG: carboxypeptidase regulatory-like domain-containing protein [Gammaproteobacteria bacterium]